MAFFVDFFRFWEDFGTILGGFGEPKSTFFSYFFENADFVKIVLPSRRELNFQGSEPLKNVPKSMPKRTRKKHRKKTHKKSVLGQSWAPFGRGLGRSWALLAASWRFLGGFFGVLNHFFFKHRSQMGSKRLSETILGGF